MRFIPAVSGVQIPPLLPEYDRKPGNFPGFFCYGLFCRVSRDAGQRPARPAGPSWKGGATGEGMSRPGSPAGGLPHTAIVWGIAAVPGWEVSRAISPGETATAQILQAGPFAGVFLLAGRKYRKSLPKESKFCRCISALWEIHKALWQGSSVGQSMRFIPAVSGVQIPPLLPETHKRFGSVPDRFFVMAVSVNTAVRNAASSALREFFIFYTSRHPGHRQLPVRISACGCSGPDRKQGWAARTGKAYGP